MRGKHGAQAERRRETTASENTISNLTHTNARLASEAERLRAESARLQATLAATTRQLTAQRDAAASPRVIELEDRLSDIKDEVLQERERTEAIERKYHRLIAAVRVHLEGTGMSNQQVVNTLVAWTGMSGQWIEDACLRAAKKMSPERAQELATVKGRLARNGGPR